MATDASSAEPASGLTDDELDTLLEHARIAEAAGQRHAARELVALVIAELNEAGHQPLLPLRWIARLEAELGEYANASRWLGIAREVAVAAGQVSATLQIDLALARAAISAGDTDAAERCLAQIPCEVGPPPPTTSTAEQIAQWADALILVGDRLAQAALRAEAALTVMELWRAAGRYRSAFALLTAARAAVVAAEPRARIAATELLEATLLFEAGETATAWRCVTAEEAAADGAVAVRASILRMRIAIRGGRLGDARREAARPIGTEDPLLLGQIAAVRIALFNELNMYEAAHREALAAVARLAGDAPASPLRALLVRAAAATELRARTAVASWELPAVPEQAFLDRWNDDIADPAVVVAPRRHDDWIPRLDAILIALEAQDLTTARAERDRLVETTRGVESRYVAARVRVACALVDYHDGGPSASILDDLIASANELRDTGARLAELQAVRFAAWSAGRLRRLAEYRELTQRALAITEQISGELERSDRIAFLMNKWSGRDEVVMLRLEHVLRSVPRRGHKRSRDLCALFNEVERLTCWPVDDALGAERARGLDRDAMPDQVAQWIADQRDPGPSDGFALRSPWSLWRFPLGTVALHYHVLPDRILLFRFAWRRIDTFVLPVQRSTLDRVLADCHAGIQSGDSPGAVEEALGWLARVLGIDDAMTAYPHAKRLVVIGHDVLANVPVAALPVGGDVLCKRVAICHVDRMSRLRRRRSRAVARFVGLGVCDYEPVMRNLPGAELEVADLARIVGADPAAQRLGSAATTRALAEALATATHVHVAAHGMFDVDDPAASAVYLHDGALALRELAAARPRDLRMVALSTCWSAEAATLPGRERICLPTALLDIGARSVIASLWEVDDQAGRAVMCDVYRELRKRGPAGALNRAQAERAGKAPLREWAGYLCYGSD
jgi:hypothetical protein